MTQEQYKKAVKLNERISELETTEELLKAVTYGMLTKMDSVDGKR